jgi:hypothetical protein
MTMARVCLEKVEWLSNNLNNGFLANVLVSYCNCEFIGQYKAEDSESALTAIAQATFSAINQVLSLSIGQTIKFTLQVAEELKHSFSEQPIFVVIVDANTGARSTRLTGAVANNYQDRNRAIASASLDAINRFINL